MTKENNEPCNDWVTHDDRGNVRCALDLGHEGEHARPPACRATDENGGTCYRDEGHPSEPFGDKGHWFEYGGRCCSRLQVGAAVVQCGLGTKHREPCKPRLGPHARLVHLLLAKLGGETWFKMPDGLSDAEALAFRESLEIEGIRRDMTGDRVVLTLAKAPASLDFVK